MSQDTSSENQGEASDRDEFSGFKAGNFYDLLGVDTDADSDEIRQAYRDQMKKHHPDRSDLPEEKAERRFEQLIQAREILEHPQKRKAYDQLGHWRYLEQSEELGQHIKQLDDDGSSTTRDEKASSVEKSQGQPQPQPKPPSVDEKSTAETETEAKPAEVQPSTGETQTSARGEAWKQGVRVPGTPEKVFAERQAAANEAPEPNQSAAQSAYQSLFSVKDELSTTSIAFVGKQWGKSWRTRVLLTLGILLIVVGGHQVLPAVAGRAGFSVSLPELSVTGVFTMALTVAILATLKACALPEMRLPRGGFVDDRELDRFSFDDAASYRKRGYFYLAFPVVLLGTSVYTDGPHPWEYTAAAIRGEFSSGFPWFPIEALGLGSYQPVFDIMLTVGFGLCVLIGAFSLSIGISIEVWRRRYDRGDKIHPSPWEAFTTAVLVSVVAALAAGTQGVLSMPGSDQLPVNIQTFFAISDGQASLGTFAGVGILLICAASAYLRIQE